MKKLFYCVTLAAAFSGAALIFNSCSKESSGPLAEGGFVELSGAGDNSKYLEEKPQMWHQDNKCICILYGYGYNDEKFIQEMNEKLYAAYGKYGEGGMILSYNYPADFKRGNKNYITFLRDFVADKDLKGIVMLGAPEGTHVAIARMQDECNGRLSYPVISLFSQDEVVAMEDSADFVLDKSQKMEINGLSSEGSESQNSQIFEIVENSVKYVSYADAPFAKTNRLYEIVRKIAAGQKVARYADSQTGLIAINHFVLE